MSAAAPRCVAVIPARWGSQRFPGKPVALLAGKPLVVHVLERVQEAGVFDAVWVATDDDRIATVVHDAGGEVRMTTSEHATGTERVAAAAASLPADAIVFNVQGDEPLVPSPLLRQLVARMRADTNIELLTAARAEDDSEAFANPNVVKVVVDARGRALYFSRAAIPHPRGARPGWLRHIGIYAFRGASLQRFVRLPASRLEGSEGLEQLRALEHGMSIDVLIGDYATHGVDTPGDLQAVAKLLRSA